MNPHPARSAEQPAQAPVESIAALMLLPIVLAFGVWLRFQHFGASSTTSTRRTRSGSAANARHPALPLAGQHVGAVRQPALDRLPARPGLAIARTRRRVPVHAGAHHAGRRSASGAAQADRRAGGADRAALFAANPWIVEDTADLVQTLAPFFVCLVFWRWSRCCSAQAAARTPAAGRADRAGAGRAHQLLAYA